MKNYVFLLFAIQLLTGPVFAAEDSYENRLIQADRYLASISVSEMLRDVIIKTAGPKTPVERRELADAFVKHLDEALVIREMKRTMARIFTYDELKALADLYESPAGKSMMSKYGDMMADVFPRIMPELDRAKAAAERELKGE